MVKNLPKILILGMILYSLSLPIPGFDKTEVKIWAPGSNGGRIDPFMINVDVEAKAAYVFDINRGEALYAKNEEVQLPLASLAKIMSVIVANENMPPPKRLVSFNGSLWDLKNIESFALVQSSNEATLAMASIVGSLAANEGDPEKTFVKAMNKKSSALGLVQTFFINPTGLDASAALAGGYGSAKDMAFLISYAVREHPDAFEATAYPEYRLSTAEGKPMAVLNTNKNVGTMPRVILSKTGFTDLAGGNLVIIFDLGFGHPVAAAVMGSSEEGRFSDMDKIIRAVYELFRDKP